MGKGKQLGNKIKGVILANKKKITFASITLLCILVLVIGWIYHANKEKQNTSITPELARAMNYPEVVEGDEAVEGTDYVKFDAFFLRDIDFDGYAESIRGTSKEIGSEDTLYMELNVLTNGYLENGVITINSNNFYLQTSIVKDTEIKNNYISNNTSRIELNSIRTGTQKLISGIVRSGDYSFASQKSVAIGTDINNYSKVNSVTLTGTHVSDEGVRTPISKTVNFDVDWYGSATAEIEAKSISQTVDITEAITEDGKQANLKFTVETNETKNQLILSSAVFKATIPQLNGYDPINVMVNGRNIDVNYEKTSRTLTAIRKATDQQGKITSLVHDRIENGKKVNKWDFTVTYPIEAYNLIGDNAITYKVPIEIYYTGYNNPNTEFTNPYPSNVAKDTIVVNYLRPEGTVAIFEVTVGTGTSNPTQRYFISKEKPLKIYNGASDNEYNDQYIVRWKGSTGSDGTGSMIMKERKNGAGIVSDSFVKTDTTEVSMNSLVNNVGIYSRGLITLVRIAMALHIQRGAKDPQWRNALNDVENFLEENLADFPEYQDSAAYRIKNMNKYQNEKKDTTYFFG